MLEDLKIKPASQAEAKQAPSWWFLEPTSKFIPFRREEIEQSIPARFEQQVRLYPNRLAVKTPRHRWTYDELNRVANRVAHAILARDGNGRTPVVLLIEQSAPLIAAHLGVLKAGKFFVVLDPSHPPSRLAQFIAEAQPTCIVTNAAHLDTAVRLAEEKCPVINLDQLAPDLAEANPGIPSAPDDLAMILYTSGSTGRPKGVLGDHRIWIHNAMNYTNAFHVCSEDRATLLALGTSQAMKNMFMALLNGAAIFPYEVRQNGLDDLVALMRREEITITVMGASLFRSLADVLDDVDQFPKLRLIRLGSEPVQKRDVDLYRKYFSSGCLLVNGLASGETQTTRFFRIDHNTEVPGSLVPVGYPVEDKTILLLDDTGKEVEAGEVGEIVVKSYYLASGYWRRPDLTEAVFQPAETLGGPRLYYSGDLGRMNPDGCLVCLGRKNSRVKIRGHGVDLLEIEMTLQNVDNVKESAVVAHQNRAGYAYLVAYIVPVTFPGPTNMILRQALAEALPDFMIPSTFVVLGDLPRTTSGKTDRQALPAPGRPYRDANRPITLPRTPVEATIAMIWSEVLGHDSIDVYDHFYDLGGESLQAMRIMARVRKTFDVDVDLQSLLDAPTVAEMALTINGLMAKTDADERNRPLEKQTESKSNKDPAASYLVQIQPGNGHRPIFFLPGGIGGGGGEFFIYARLAHHVGPDYPFYGLKARSAEGKESSQPSVVEMARDYLEAIRSFQPEGPYIIVGECAGGIIAYEIAQQLRRQGQKIALLVLMDTHRTHASLDFRKRLNRFLALCRRNYYVMRLNYHREQLRKLKGTEKLSYLLGKSSKVFAELPQIQQSIVSEDPDQEIEYIQRSYSRAIYRYRPRPYFGKMTLLVNEEVYQSNPHLGWEGLVRGGLEIHKLPGNHTSYLRDNFQIAAKKLHECFEKAEA
jgi:amino acid adenylation domain-containing protein